MADAALTPADRRARAGSGLTSRLMLSYVEREGGRDAVERVLAETGLADQEALLRDEGHWFSYDTKLALWAAAERALGDRLVAERAGAAVLEFTVATPLKRALRALGSPEFVVRNVARANHKFNWAHTLEVLAAAPGTARLRYVDVCGVGYHRYDCEYTRGLLRTIPQLFGMPAALVEHPVCGVLGDGHCEFTMTWSPGLQHVRRDAVLVGASATGLAIGGLAVPPLLALAAVVAAGGGAGLAARTISHLRRRVQTLETRVAEQDVAAERLFGSLGDLSSDLRPDEVLDKISRRASDAVGGKQYVLLLARDGRLEADRHSGVPTASLEALERWATDRLDAMRDAPLLVDDVGTVPALRLLAADPDVPLGSLCAAPLWIGDAVLGALVALAHGSAVFLPHETRALAAYADQAAIALSNARLVDRLERQAGEDPLTGLANRRAFEQACSAEFARAQRDGSAVALVALDLDHFKSINDAHGHPYGDEVLRASAEALRGAVRPHDTVGRVGGEEFAILLPGADADAAHEVAERARAAIAEVPVQDRTLSSSAGVASHPECGAGGVERLFGLADSALYAAKERGRNRTVRADHGPATDRVTASELAHVLMSGGLEVVVQPIVALATARVVCHEALARFPGLPGRPIPQVFREAHRSGLGPRLEALAVQRALELPGRPPGTALSVNLSVTALCSPDVWEVLPEQLAGLIVEITEDAVFGGGPELERAISRLRERGAHIALDDAGAGYAGLQQLIRVRPDVVKLDRSLVAGVAGDPARAALVASFTAFAAQTGGAVCAEGLEDPEDLRVLADLDVNYVQGYLLGRPAPGFVSGTCEAAAAVASPLRGGLRVLVAGAPDEHAGAAGASAERLAMVLCGAAAAERADVWALDRRCGDLVALRAGGRRVGDRLALSAWPARAHAVLCGEAGQILRNDRGADRAERDELARQGLGGALLVPIGEPGAVRGLVVCYREQARPWSRETTARIRALAAPLAARLQDTGEPPVLATAA